MIGTKIVRIEVDKETWNKIRAKASLRGMSVKDYANEVFRKDVEDFKVKG